MLIDAHLHVHLYEGMVEGIIKGMDSLGIEKGLMLGATREIFFRAECGNNEDVLKVVKKFRDRFIGGVYLDPRDPNAIDILHRYIDQGFLCAKFLPFVGYYMDKPEFFPLYEEMNKLGLPAVVHCGLTNVPFSNRNDKTTHSKYCDPIYLDGIVRLFPKVNWIIAHMAWPFFDVAWGLAQFNDNVYLDLSGPHAPVNGLRRLEREGQGFTCDVDLFSKMVWGSDTIDAPLYFNYVKDLMIRVGKKDMMPAVFGGTIEGLLG